MTTRLGALLASIHPSRTIEAVDRRTDDAVNSFPIPDARITDWDTYRAFLADFVRHVERTVLRMRSDGGGRENSDFYWGRCRQILLGEYGPNGDKAAFEMVRTGNDGGLYAVLGRVARGMATKYAETEIRARIQQAWNGWSAQEKFSAADEYLDRYGRLLPSEMTESGGTRLRAEFSRVLEEHPKMMARLGRIGRL